LLGTSENIGHDYAPFDSRPNSLLGQDSTFEEPGIIMILRQDRCLTRLGVSDQSFSG
jgi:hypothetical protein